MTIQETLSLLSALTTSVRQAREALATIETEWDVDALYDADDAKCSELADAIMEARRLLKTDVVTTPADPLMSTLEMFRSLGLVK